jgi:hypothetical protein
VRVDGSAYELISNLSPEQQAERVDPLKDILLKPYELSPIMIESAQTGDRRIDVAEDEYGYFRSCLIPVKTTNGDAVLFGADMEISAINDRLFQDLIANIGIGLGVLIGMLIIIRMLSSAIARELLSVVRETEAVSRLVFLNNETRARSNTLEIDQLFGALFDMKNGLRAFSKYVPKAVVTQVLGSGKAEIGGERRELSLLMTDVTDFTTISEQLEPERVMIVMSEYFDRVVAPILAAMMPSRSAVTASLRSFTRSHFQRTRVAGSDWTVRASDCAATASPRPRTRAMKTARTTFCWRVASKRPASTAQRTPPETVAASHGKRTRKAFTGEACCSSWM